MIVKHNSYLNLIQLRPSYELNPRFIYPIKERSYQARYRADSFNSLTRNYRSLTQKIDTQQSSVQQELTCPPKQLNKFLSQNNSPIQPKQKLLLWQQQSVQLPQTLDLQSLNLSVTNLKSEVKRLVDLNAELMTQVDTKDSQLKSTKHKLNQYNQKHIRSQSRSNESSERKVQLLEEENQKLSESLKELQKSTEELIIEHNREIADLKCNMRNSIFEEEEIPDRPQPNLAEKQWSFAQQPLNLPINQLNQYSDEILTNSISQVQLQINLLREENSIYRQLLNNIENQDEDLVDIIREGNQKLLDLYETKFSQQIAKLEKDNLNLQNQNESNQLTDNTKLQELLSQFDDIDEQKGENIVNKIIRLLDQQQQLEEELDDWKRDYWILEKKLNQMEINQENPTQTKSNQIELEFDFIKNQLSQYEELNAQLQQERAKCKQLEEQLQKQKQVEIINTPINTPIPFNSALAASNPSNRKFADHLQLIAQTQFRGQMSPVHMNIPSRNVITYSPILKQQQYIPLTPIIIKHPQSSSPFQYTNISKILNYQ